MKGELPEDELPEASGVAEAATAPGQAIGAEGSARLAAHAVPPAREEAELVARRRLEPRDCRLPALRAGRERGRRPDAIAVVDADLDDHAAGGRDVPLDDCGERPGLDVDDVGNGRTGRARSRGEERGGGRERKQDHESRTAPHVISVGTFPGNPPSLDRGMGPLGSVDAPCPRQF